MLKIDQKSIEQFNSAIQIFIKTRDIWTKEMDKSIHGIKDNKDFVNLLLSELRKKNTIKTDTVEDMDYVYKGVIKNIIKDRYGKYCGFIDRRPNNIFFHSSSVKGIQLLNSEGKLVSYKVSTNPKSGQLLATDVEFA